MATTEFHGAGVYNAMPPEQYHADPVPDGSLSSGGVRRLLDPSCPAKYRWWADHPEPPKPEFDFGHAAHRKVLGIGADIVIIAGTGKDENAWRTDDDKAAVEAARVAGQIPVKPRDMVVVDAMAAALREHPVARALFEPGTGLAEQSLFWRDPEFGVWRRARPDWLPFWYTSGGQLVIPDYKTCTSANPADLERAIVQHGYDQQAAWYLDPVGPLQLGDPNAVMFVFVFQEKTPPYVVTTVQPDVVMLKRGRMRNRLAMSIFLECSESGVWPGYVEGLGTLSLPPWVENEFDDELEHGVYDVLKGQVT